MKVDVTIKTDIGNVIAVCEYLERASMLLLNQYENETNEPYKTEIYNVYHGLLNLKTMLNGGS